MHSCDEHTFQFKGKIYTYIPDRIPAYKSLKEIEEMHTSQFLIWYNPRDHIVFNFSSELSNYYEKPCYKKMFRCILTRYVPWSTLWSGRGCIIEGNLNQPHNNIIKIDADGLDKHYLEMQTIHKYDFYGNMDLQPILYEPRIAYENIGRSEVIGLATNDVIGIQNQLEAYGLALNSKLEVIRLDE